MANILVTCRNDKGTQKPVGIFSQKQKVWDYIEPDLNEDFTMRIFPNDEKEYKISKATISRLLKENKGVVLREAGMVRYVAVNIEQNPVRK